MSFGEMSFLNKPEKKQEGTVNEKDKKIIFPHAESILRLFRNKYENEPEKAEIMEDIFYEFFEQEMKNTDIFESKKFDVAFPWTYIRTNDLLKKVIAKHSNKENLAKTLNSLTSDGVVRKQEFIFSSGSMMKSGYQFTFVEEAMQQAVVALKSGLISLQKGEAIKNREIYTLGLPTNELGKVSAVFLEKLKQDPFGSMSDIQAEFVESRIPKKGTKTQYSDVKFYGVSTGASFAAAAGEKLIKNGVLTQSYEDAAQQTPHLSIRMDSPVGLSKSTRKNWQIPLGYVAEFVYQTFKDPKFRLADPKFMNQVKQALNSRGIKEKMTDEDKKMKSEAIGLIIGKLKEGIDFSQDLKVTKVTGIMDPLTFSPEGYKTEKNRQAKLSGVLGKNISPRSEINRREFMINMTHTPDFFRDSEIRRCYAVASLVQKLQISS